MKDKKGSATILSLLISAIIITVSIGFNWFVKEHIKAAEALKYKTEAMITTNSAYETLIYSILSGSFSQKEVALYNGKKLLGIDSMPLDGSQVNLKDSKVKIKIRDSNGLISLTTIYDIDALGRLLNIIFPNKKDVSVVVASLRDWIDDDDFSRVNGAESFYYKSHGKPYKSRNYPIQYIEEIGFVRGMEDVNLEKIMPYLTIMPSSGFNPNTAPDEVLMAYLDISKDVLENLKNYRANKSINSNADLFMLTGKMLPAYLSELNNFMPSRFWEVQLDYEKDNKTIYFIKSGINTSVGMRTPYMISYWKEG
ncbi:MAG: general secretion pathway protein GspK [Thermodesulfovibrionales bacterium]|nr:general secretion pathway protein GspK [Thermodesulfovibrionales bacterium]